MDLALVRIFPCPAGREISRLVGILQQQTLAPSLALKQILLPLLA
jgi:hypothetical protein